MEIFDEDSGSALGNISSKYPIFAATSLDSGRNYKLFIYSVNLRGRSDPIIVEGYTLKAAEKQTGKLFRSTLTI